MRRRQNGRHFADDLFKCIFSNENVWISLNIWLKFVYKVQIKNIPALVQIMAWCQSGDKPLSKPMVVRLPTLVCATRSRWVKPQYKGNGKDCDINHSFYQYSFLEVTELSPGTVELSALLHEDHCNPVVARSPVQTCCFKSDIESLLLQERHCNPVDSKAPLQHCCFNGTITVPLLQEHHYGFVASTAPLQSCCFKSTIAILLFQ